ncbi:MAG: hypothetical protein CL886_06500 [Dehalococcoidia bacterium]|nr:hypothetical protein [Dehalococcoidia bacterium]|tara:strand:- start:978 stop:1562 length:585 start_codon:yes stop_codon:yes gene_type:complete
MIHDIAFWSLSVITIVSAIGVVVTKDLFRSALLLAVFFVGIAGFFFLLSAEFLAVVQVLIYVGAISILFIFAVMLTSDIQRGNPANRMQVVAMVVPALLLVAVLLGVFTSQWVELDAEVQDTVDLVHTRAVGGISESEFAAAVIDDEFSQKAIQEADIADLLVGEYVLAFEGVSVLLLGALIGSLALARGKGSR